MKTSPTPPFPPPPATPAGAGRLCAWQRAGARWHAAALAVLAAASLRAESAAPAAPGPLDLKAAITFALDHNFSIRQARERIRQQEGVVVEATGRAIPNLAATASYRRNSGQLAPTIPASDRSWSGDVTASQTLFAGGGVRSSIRSSRLARDAARIDLQSTINDALLAVRVAFYNVLLAREKIKVQEENLALLQQQLKNTSDRFDAGTVSAFDKLRAEVAVANARVPLITARNDHRLALETLRQTLGLATEKPDALQKPPELVGSLDYAPVSFNLQTAFDTARASRPDLQRLARLVAADEQSVASARSNYYPDLSLVGGWELRKGPTNSFGDSRDGLFAGLQSRWNIFDGRATAGRVAQARSVLEQTRLQLTEAELAAEVEVRTAHSSLQEATELAEASQKVVTQAEEAVRLATARYDAGSATQLDVLQSQVDLTTARTNQIQAYYSYNVALDSLRKAMGLVDPFVPTS